MCTTIVALAATITAAAIFWIKKRERVRRRRVAVDDQTNEIVAASALLLAQEQELTETLQAMARLRYSRQPRELKIATINALLPPARDPLKPTLVLDLDETLVHAVPAVKPMFPSELLKVSQDDGDFALWLAIRPHVHQFLSSLAAHYELVVWTAGTEPYGRAVVQRLDPSGSFISHSLYRQHCTQRDGRFIKDLSRLGRDERTRICDNNPVSFSFQPSAGILVNDFVGDPQDVELVKLLRQLTPTNDVEMVDVEHVPFSARRVRFGLFVNVKMYDPEAAPYVEDVEMVDTEALRSSLKMFNELGPVGVEDEAVESTVRYGCIALPCRTNTAFSSDFEAQEQAVPRAEESVEVPVTAPKRPVFEEQEVPQAEEPVEDEDTAPKRPRRPRVSNGGPLRRSPRLAKKYPRRSPRLVAKRLAAKP